MAAAGAVAVQEHPITLNDLQRSIITRIMRGDAVVAAQCGWGAGKTTALVFACLFVAKTRPGRAMLIVTDTQQRFNDVLQPALTQWLQPLGWTWHERDRRWRDPHTGSEIYTRAYFRPGTRSATHNPLEGMNITSNVAFIDECQTLSPEVAQKVLGRLRAKGHPPTRVLVGLPVADAWWRQLAEDRGLSPLLFSSYVNQANLSAGWFEDVKADPEEFEAMVMNRPAPPVGQVYADWRAVAYPKGNLTPDGWRYRPDMTTRIALDPGVRKPSVLFIAHDAKLGADVVVGELNPNDVTLDELAALVLGMAWPRALADQVPKDGRDRFWLDAGSIDKAARARNDRTLRSTVQDLARAPADGGIGMQLRTTTDPVRTDIRNGIDRTKRRILHNGQRRLLCAQDVWAQGGMGQSNTFRKAVQSYRYPEKGGDLPLKDGREDPLDALRYDTINWCWVDASPSARAMEARRTQTRMTGLMRRGGRPKSR